MSDSPVNINRNGSVFELILNRPKANAIDGATSRMMGEAFVEFRDNPDYRVAIVSAAGEKFFCAGWDLKAAAAGEEPTTDYGEGGWAGIQELPNLNIQIANGKFNHLINWLRSNVHSKGSLSNSEDLVKKVTGEELNIEYFKKHLINRYLN